MQWTDIEDIAEELEDRYPEVNLMTLRFTKLYEMVLCLERFNDLPDKCNEKILEAIQQNWLELREEK